MLVVLLVRVADCASSVVRSGQASTGRACEKLMGFMRPAFNRPGRPLFPDNAVYAQVFYRLDLIAGQRPNTAEMIFFMNRSHSLGDGS
jgi:hypothetical protein